MRQTNTVWRLSCLCPLLAACLGWAAQAQPAAPTPAPESPSRALVRASDAVIGVQTQAVENARSSAALGPRRQGSGVVIGNDGLVLTIGYLVLEAQSIELRPDDGRRIPARLVAYDMATGFGLVQALAPLKLEPVPLGDAAAAQANEPLMVASGGEGGSVTLARLVSQRAFSGYWEYHIESALFTAPPRGDHSGAGLFNSRGELIGIGSLLVADAAGADKPRLPGNMFVPIDLLKPVLAELRERGSSRASTRAWLGLNCVEIDGQVRVLRVNDDSPADVAGLQVGDRVARIDGTEVTSLSQLWKALWAGGAPERAVTLEILRDGRPQTLVVQSVDRAKTLRRAEGI